MVLVVIRFSYLSDLGKLVSNVNCKLLQRLKKLLVCTPLGMFNDKASSIYPEGWKKSGTTSGNGNYFKSTNSLLYAGTIFLVAVILLKCSPQNFNHKSQNDDFDSTVIFLNR